MKLFERFLTYVIALFLVLNLVYLVKLNTALQDLQARYDELQPSIEEASRVIRQLGKVGEFFSPREKQEDPLERVTRKLEKYLDLDSEEPLPPVEPEVLFDDYIKRIESTDYVYYWDGRPFRAVNMGAQLRRKFPQELQRTRDIVTLERRMFHSFNEQTGAFGPAYEVEIDGVRRNLYTWLTGRPAL